MKPSTPKLLLFFSLLAFSFPSIADPSSNASRVINIDLVPVGSVKPMWYENKTAGFGAAAGGLLGPLAGVLAELIASAAQSKSTIAPEFVDAQDKKLLSMFEVSKPQLFFSKELSKQLERCKFVSTPPLEVYRPALKADEFLENQKAFSSSSTTPSGNISYIAEIGGLIFPYKSASNFDEIEVEGEVRFYKLPSYELVKKYSVKTAPGNGVFIRDGQESSATNLGEFKDASEKVLIDLAKDISKLACTDKRNGLFN